MNERIDVPHTEWMAIVCVCVCVYKSCKCAIASEVRLMYEAWLYLNVVYTEWFMTAITFKIIYV